MSEAETVFRAVVEAAEAGEQVALATVIDARGSTPRGVGSKMLIRPEGTLVGTIGGGCGESDVIEAARRVLETGEAVRVKVELTEDEHSWSPAVCGGIMDVFVEPVHPDVE